MTLDTGCQQRLDPRASLEAATGKRGLWVLFAQKKNGKMSLLLARVSVGIRF
jgi:hypothetical protein